jgi:L-fuculose-phosphate aldolase
MIDSTAQRQEMVRIGRWLYERQLVVAAEGNLSVRLAPDRYLVTPAGLCKGLLAPGQLIEVDAGGQVLPGGSSSSAAGLAPVRETPDGQAPAVSAPCPFRPSSEWPLHREIYALRPEIGAICHAHPAWATAFAAAGQSLDGCLLPEIVATLGAVPLAPYGTPGTEEVPASVRDLIPHHDALLLANHGVIAIGGDLTEAFFKLESIERLAQITLLARLAGGERRLSRREAEAVQKQVQGPSSPDTPLLCIPGGEWTAAELETEAQRLAREILSELGRQS